MKKLTDKQRAAKKRVDAAINHLFKAITEVNHAMADISRVNGATVPYRKLVKLNEGLIESKLMLGQADFGTGKYQWELDHDPTPQELRCGHGPRHGCGRGKR